MANSTVAGSGRVEPEPASSRPFAELGALLLDAGLSVTDTRRALERVRDAQAPRAPLTFIVLPATVLIGHRDGGAPLTGGAPTRGELSTHQSAAGLRLLRDLERRALALAPAVARMRAIRRLPNRGRSLRWAAGSALLAVGLAILVHCPWWAIALSACTGAVVGIVSAAITRVSSAAAIAPFVASFVSTSLVGWVASWWDLGPVPLFAVCAPVAILVPGAMITNALLELTSADMVTGSARLVSGLVVLGFMAAGIIAGSALTGLRLDPGSAALIGDVPAPSTALEGWGALPPAWAAWLGVVALAIGVGLAFGADIRLTTIGIVAMAGAYAVLSLLTPAVGAIAATGLTGMALFIASRLLERTRASVPAAISFQPAFLLLVPGTVGLVALTTLDPGSLSTVPLTFVSLCLGTKAGSVLADADWARLFSRGRGPSAGAAAR